MKITYQQYQSHFPLLIDSHQSFEIVGVPTDELKAVTDMLERYIESIHLKCRIYTKNRVVAGAAGLLNPAWGVLALAGIAAHNIVTWDPDYEIGRDIANNRVSVDWKKK